MLRNVRTLYNIHVVSQTSREASDFRVFGALSIYLLFFLTECVGVSGGARDQQGWVDGWAGEWEMRVRREGVGGCGVGGEGRGACSMAASLFLVDPQETICAGGID